MKWIMHKKIIYVNSIESDNNLYKIEFSQIILNFNWNITIENEK